MEKQDFESLLPYQHYFLYDGLTLNQVKLILMILFKPSWYSLLLGKIIGLVNFVTKLSGLLKGISLTE